MTEKKCTEEGCEKPRHDGHLLCGAHYMRKRRADPNRPRCAEPGCDRAETIRGLCDNHWQQGVNPPRPPQQRRRPPPKPCSEPGCEHPSTRRGLCPNHYFQWYRRTGKGRANDDRNRMRRAVKAGAEAEQVLRADIFERDGWRCGICGRKVRRDLAWPDPGSPSLDHIIPLSEGGAHTATNLRLTHLRCNTSKGARTVPTGEQLLLIG